MKIELKKISVSVRLSQETIAFAADIWVDGKRVGTATNSGTGGATNVHISPADLRQRVMAYGAALMPPKSFSDGPEAWLIDQLLEVHLQAKEDAKLSKIDKRESAALAKMGLAAARFQTSREWRWFGYKPGTDPMVTAQQIATKRAVVVTQLKVVS